LHGCCPLDRTPQSVENMVPAPFIVQNLLDKIRVRYDVTTFQMLGIVCCVFV
jgi:hypothetical protein